MKTIKHKNSFITSLAAVAAFTLAGPASAVVLLTDNFDSVTSFTANPNADQTGTLAGATYTVSSIFNDPHSTRGSGKLEMAKGQVAGDRVFTNADYITYANANDTAIQFSFNYDASSADWVGFTVGTASSWATQGEFTAIFTNSGTTQAWIGAVAQSVPTAFTYPQTITLELRGTAGGSAFDGGGSVAQIWAGSTSIATYTLAQLNATNGKFTFNAYNGGTSAGGTVDNFSITAIPEPSAALLGGLGMLALLRRRRA